jgi:hypothetical protein
MVKVKIAAERRRAPPNRSPGVRFTIKRAAAQ